MIWKTALKAIAWLTVGSNLYLFAFTSSQMKQWFPAYYITDEVTGQSLPDASSTHEILLVVLMIEHVLLIIAILGRNAIAVTPKSVCDEIQKRLWCQENLASNARVQTAKRSSEEITSHSQRVKKAGFNPRPLQELKPTRVL